MFLITIDGSEEGGAFSVTNSDDEKIIYIFQEEDDAVRYAIMLEDLGYPETHVIEYDSELLIKTCEITGNKYTVITPHDMVIPRENFVVL
jgi:hypothetical protein